MSRIMFITTYNPGVIGIRYVGACLKREGHEVWFVHFKEFRPCTVPTKDWKKHQELSESAVKYVYFQHPGYRVYAPYPTPITDKERELLIDFIRDKKPDVIGFSLFSVTLDVVKDLTALIKKQFPDIPVAWGGVHCILRPEECIKYADIVCAGEGEDAFPALLRDWDNYKSGKIPEIPGLWFRLGDKIFPSDENPIVDVEKVPFPMMMENEIVIDDDQISYKMNEPNVYIHNQIYVFTERGCPYKCSYCIHSMLKIPGFKKFRRRSVQSVLDEVGVRVNKYGFKHIIFHDEILGIDKSWVRDLTRGFKERFTPLGITFTGYVHPMTTDAEMLEWLVDAGMTRAGMGIQSGCEYTNTMIYDRDWTPDKIIELSRLLSKYTFEEVQYDLLTHNPYEKEEHRRETLEFLLKLCPPFHVEPFSLVIYDLTRLAHKDLPKYGVDLQENLFWNMLYFMTGLKGRDADFIRDCSNNKYFRESPEVLEEFVAELLKLDKMEWQRTWELHNVKKNQEMSAIRLLERQGIKTQVKTLFRTIKRKILSR